MANYPSETPTRNERSGDRAVTSGAPFGKELAAGAQLGNYLIESLRSRGGFAAVYRAKHVTLGRTVAIKVLHESLADSPSMIQRFEQEAQAVNLIRHPNVVDIFEFGELDDGRPYFVMEWLEGSDLSELLAERGRLAPSEALAVIEELGAALLAAHAQGVVHRDLKASNVFAIPSGEWFSIKLVDFGVLKLLDGARMNPLDLTATGTQIGTPTHMAPEQIRAQVVDQRTDIYAFGILVYQLLTNELPFDDEDPARVQQMHLASPPPRVSDRARVPAALDAVIAKCLAKDPDDRYSSIQEMLNELRRGLTAAEAQIQTLRAIGLYIEARLPEHAGDLADSVLDELDSALLSAQELFSRIPLEVAFQSPGSMLAIGPLPEEPAPARKLRRRVLQEAATWLDERGASTVQLLVSTHIDEVVVKQGAPPQFIGGELLRLSHWASGDRGGVVAASPDVLDDLAEELSNEPFRHRILKVERSRPA